MYSGPWQVKKDPVYKKDPQAPKKPMSAYLSFSNSRRASVKRENPNATNAQVSKTLATMWKNAPEAVRQEYINTEATLRERYKVDIANWKERLRQANEGDRIARERLALERTMEIEAINQRASKEGSDLSPLTGSIATIAAGKATVSVAPSMTSNDTSIPRDVSPAPTLQDSGGGLGAGRGRVSAPLKVDSGESGWGGNRHGSGQFQSAIDSSDMHRKITGRIIPTMAAREERKPPAVPPTLEPKTQRAGATEDAAKHRKVEPVLAVSKGQNTTSSVRSPPVPWVLEQQQPVLVLPHQQSIREGNMRAGAGPSEPIVRNPVSGYADLAFLPHGTSHTQQIEAAERAQRQTHVQGQQDSRVATGTRARGALQADDALFSAMETTEQGDSPEFEPMGNESLSISFMSNRLSPQQDSGSRGSVQSSVGDRNRMEVMEDSPMMAPRGSSRQHPSVPTTAASVSVHAVAVAAERNSNGTHSSTNNSPDGQTNGSSSGGSIPTIGHPQRNFLDDDLSHDGRVMNDTPGSVDDMSSTGNVFDY